MDTEVSEDLSDERGGSIVEGAGDPKIEIDLDRPKRTVGRMRVDARRGLISRDHAPPAQIPAQTERSLDDRPSRQAAIA